MRMRSRETEVKIRIADLDATRKRLREIGFRLRLRRCLEDNVLLDTPDRALRRVRSILRLRRYRSRWWLTYKGTPATDPHYKSRLELETEIKEPRIIRSIFAALGFQPVFRYQKYRAQYGEPVPKGKRHHRGEGAEVFVDETPIGNFLEVEGTRKAIDKVAHQLGFSRQDYLTASYGALYLEECQKKKIPAGDMVFPFPGRRKSGKF